MQDFKKFLIQQLGILNEAFTEGQKKIIQEWKECDCEYDFVNDMNIEDSNMLLYECIYCGLKEYEYLLKREKELCAIEATIRKVKNILID